MALKVKVITIDTANTVYKASKIEAEIGNWLKKNPVEIVSTDMIVTEGRDTLFTIIYKEIEL